MGATILVLFLLARVPQEPAAADMIQSPLPATKAVTLSQYQTEQIVWWLYYGELAVTTEPTPQPEREVVRGREAAAAKTSRALGSSNRD